MPNAKLILSFAALAAATETSAGPTALTGCQKCAAPGGDCSKAFKQQPGKHCGDVNELSFCCPTNAKCWACNNAYRCYTGTRPSPNICVAEGGTNGVNPSASSHSSSRHSSSEGSELITLVIFMVLVLALGSAFSACLKQRRPLASQQAGAGIPMQTMVQAQPGKPMPAVAGMPVGAAMPGQPMAGYPAQPMGYPAQYPMQQQGYGGGTVAMGAGMGFLGGMMVGDMMADAGGHYGGGGYGGDYGGGGDFGGGDGGFAADM